MRSLHTSEALAPLIVALAHTQVALALISIYLIGGPCTGPCPKKTAPFRPSKRYTVVYAVNQFLLAYLGAYGTHMFALWVWVGDGTSKTFFFLFYHFENVWLGVP